MDSLSLSTLTSLTYTQKTTLGKANIHTVADLVLTPPTEIAKRCRLTLQAAEALVNAVAAGLTPAPTRLDSGTLTSSLAFTTGDVALDTVFGGGIRTGMVWEIVGESAAGKTQLALQLSLFVKLPPELKGLLGAACFLSTSWILPTNRILEMINSHPALSPALCGLADIHTLKVTTIPMLLHVLSQTLVAFMDDRLRPDSGKKHVKLVVIDALTELFHSESRTSSTSLAQRAKDIAEISCLLHTLADKYNLAIVVLNEVADAFDRSIDTDAGHQQHEVLYRDQVRWFSRAHTIPGENRKEAALGLTWANQVNARVMLTRTDRMIYLDEDDETRAAKRRRLDRETKADVQSASISGGQQGAVRLRHLTVIFSSVGLPGSLDYIVSEQGVVVVSEEKHTSLFSAPSQPAVTSQPPIQLALPAGSGPGSADGRSQEIVPSSQPSEQLLELGTVVFNSDDLADAQLAQVEVEEGPEADDWEAYWKDSDDMDDFYSNLDLDALSSSNPG